MQFRLISRFDSTPSPIQIHFGLRRTQMCIKCALCSLSPISRIYLNCYLLLSYTQQIGTTDIQTYLQPKQEFPTQEFAQPSFKPFTTFHTTRMIGIFVQVEFEIRNFMLTSLPIIVIFGKCRNILDTWQYDENKGKTYSLDLLSNKIYYVIQSNLVLICNFCQTVQHESKFWCFFNKNNFLYNFREEIVQINIF